MEPRRGWNIAQQVGFSIANPRAVSYITATTKDGETVRLGPFEEDDAKWLADLHNSQPWGTTMPCPVCAKLGLSASRTKSVFGIPITTMMELQDVTDATGAIHQHDPNLRTDYWCCESGHSWEIRSYVGCLRCKVKPKRVLFSREHRILQDLPDDEEGSKD